MTVPTPRVDHIDNSSKHTVGSLVIVVVETMVLEFHYSFGIKPGKFSPQYLLRDVQQDVALAFQKQLGSS